MRYIHEIFTADCGRRWENRELLPIFEAAIGRLDLPDARREELLGFVRFQLVGERARRCLVPAWTALDVFARRAAAFEAAAETALDALAERIVPAAEAAGIRFDAVIATTATGNLMPGLSYRMARRLGGRVRPETVMLDLANVGCTGSLKALNLARRLDASLRHLLLVAVEVPSTLADLTGTEADLWQGNCTFGDGAAALWISDDPDAGPGALAVEEVHFRQRADTGFDLIRWSYRNYYAFALANPATFDREVREHVEAALAETEAGWRSEPRWAIHPAGILLLMKLSRRLGIPGEAIQPTARHYREYSNMSSAGILYILRDVAAETPAGDAVNLLTMGAGFNVIYGRVRRIR